MQVGPAESLYEDCTGEVYPFGASVYRFSDNQPDSDCVLPISKLALPKETNDKSVFQTDAASIEAEQYWVQIVELIVRTTKEDMEHEKSWISRYAFPKSNCSPYVLWPSLSTAQHLCPILPLRSLAQSIPCHTMSYSYNSPFIDDKGTAFEGLGLNHRPCVGHHHHGSYLCPRSAMTHVSAAWRRWNGLFVIMILLTFRGSRSRTPVSTGQVPEAMLLYRLHLAWTAESMPWSRAPLFPNCGLKTNEKQKSHGQVVTKSPWEIRF